MAALLISKKEAMHFLTDFSADPFDLRPTPPGPGKCLLVDERLSAQKKAGHLKHRNLKALGSCL